MARQWCWWRSTSCSKKSAQGPSDRSTCVPTFLSRPEPRHQWVPGSQDRTSPSMQEKKGKGDGQLQYEIKLYQIFQGIRTFILTQLASRGFMILEPTKTTIASSWSSSSSANHWKISSKSGSLLLYPARKDSIWRLRWTSAYRLSPDWSRSIARDSCIEI